MKKLKEYGLCVAGALLVAVGVYFFKVPNHYSTGGVSGVSIILSGYFHLSSAGTVLTAINLLMLLLGFIFCGKECGVKTVIGTVTLSGAMLLLEKFVPVPAPLTSQPFLELIYSVLLPAVGSAILFNIGGSTGGTDIVAMLLKKHASINIGAALLYSDAVITLGSFLFGVQAGLFALLGLVMKATVVDLVIENINLCKCVSIVTAHKDEISDYINGTVGRGATVIEAEGSYTQERKYLIITAVTRLQAASLRRFLRQNYPESFLMITNSSEIIGKGFRGF
ncbi:Uncharacterized membrane-anchored protein YitT, contains DUF161 and DUF2179 domains [Sporobacter termitidis DSM 10068]|uniref:Uncharacterized membrane-anchored protein YitT, contains DUF161 and DUF2179 domains n=1 Tax=Sporobacter termitidis DSM 10068 TaxID=1123282 RepID=A0A1M5YK83_9FIRM|nr:YitT family protein [Sporobacter termitidis]SHI12400.1 Uncharacterized membrane-anchored protein YitT, contains DUF161 and DUF2179 domains [Sporobacter termitidis DSM 10068]